MIDSKILPREFYNNDTVKVAKNLLGKKLVRIIGKKTLVCEATGNYFFHPYAAERIKKYLPNVKLIVMMRNPVERTFSQYRRQVRHGKQSASFEEALENEHKLYEKEFQKFLEKYFHLSLRFLFQAVLQYE